MTPSENHSAPGKPDPGVKEQVLMTLKILSILFAIFGALWLFENLFAP